MTISLINNLSFTSTPLYDVKLKKQNSDGTISELPATFSKLDNKDQDDISRVADLCGKWHNANYGVAAGRDFLISDEDEELEDFDFYVIEGNGKNGNREIYSIAEFDRNSRAIELLQANPENAKKEIKGSGELMLWGIAKKNKSNDSPETFFLSSSHEALGFYSRLGLIKYGYSFMLPSDGTDRFLRTIEEKYHLDTNA